MGEKDVFFQAHVLMRQAMAKEGLTLVNLVAPGTGHVQEPATHREQLRRINQILADKPAPAPQHLRFVTWSLRYHTCHWLALLGMDEHYVRAVLDARIDAAGRLTIAEPTNVTRFAILAEKLPAALRTVTVGGESVPLPSPQGAPPRKPAFEKSKGHWICLGERDSIQLSGKRPGLQGPIDDAFTSGFLCVRGTGKPWNPPVCAWSAAALARCAYEWNRYFRGELPVKDDVAVTDDDARRCHLILFGDPGSNVWIRRVLPHLPIHWTGQELQVGRDRYTASDHAPLLIQPNPLVAGRYVVLNSGHTFHEPELSTLNYLLFPRLGDGAVLTTSTPNSSIAASLQASS